MRSSNIKTLNLQVDFSDLEKQLDSLIKPKLKWDNKSKEFVKKYHNKYTHFKLAKILGISRGYLSDRICEMRLNGELL
jgi:hypothetical protein